MRVGRDRHHAHGQPSRHEQRLHSDISQLCCGDVNAADAIRCPSECEHDFEPDPCRVTAGGMPYRTSIRWDSIRLQLSALDLSSALRGMLKLRTSK